MKPKYLSVEAPTIAVTIEFLGICNVEISVDGNQVQVDVIDDSQAAVVSSHVHTLDTEAIALAREAD